MKAMKRQKLKAGRVLSAWLKMALILGLFKNEKGKWNRIVNRMIALLYTSASSYLWSDILLDTFTGGVEEYYTILCVLK